MKHCTKEGIGETTFLESVMFVVECWDGYETYGTSYETLASALENMAIFKQFAEQAQYKRVRLLVMLEEWSA